MSQWESLGGEVAGKFEYTGYRVLQPGDVDDGYVRELLAGKFGGAPREWVRRSEWSAADGEIEVTAIWARPLTCAGCGVYDDCTCDEDEP
jgi:hypothetical protein